MTWNIFVDGDNIPVQRYVDHIAADARKYTNGVDVPPLFIVSQTSYSNTNQM